MNQEHSLPEDRNCRTDEDAGAQRLAEIEQRLKQAKPRPPTLDLSAIIRSAQDQPVAASRQSAPHGRSGSSRWVATVAGAWACGAIAGALVTFTLLGRTTPTEAPSIQTTVQNEQPPKVSVPDREETPQDDVQRVEPVDLPPEHEPTWTPAESHLAIALLVPYQPTDSPYGDDRPALRAGALTGGRAASVDLRSPYWISTLSPDIAGTRDAGGDTQPYVELDLDSKQPMTRGQLLNELLGAPSDPVL